MLLIMGNLNMKRAVEAATKRKAMDSPSKLVEQSRSFPNFFVSVLVSSCASTVHFISQLRHRLKCIKWAFDFAGETRHAI